MAEGRRQAGWSAVGGERRLCRPWEDIAGEGVLVGWGGPLHSWLPCFNADGSRDLTLKIKSQFVEFLPGPWLGAGGKAWAMVTSASGPWAEALGWEIQRDRPYAESAEP